MKHSYWFKPARFWNIFAAYYPISWEGWCVSIASFVGFVTAFALADATSHSASDTLINVAPEVIVILLIFDLISFRTGEYPSWWKKQR